MEILLLLIAALLIGAIVIYNRLVRDRNRVMAAWSDIDVQLKRCRAQITPAGRGRREKTDSSRPEPHTRRAMTWARRLKRVFWIDIETCEHCGGALRIIASIEDPAVIERILVHIEPRDGASATPHAPRAPPATLSGQPD